MAMNVKKGDTVIVLSGKDKGKQGKVLGTVPSEAKVVVEGINKVRPAASWSAKRLCMPPRSRWSAPSAARAPASPTRSRAARRPASARSAALSCKKGES